MYRKNRTHHFRRTKEALVALGFHATTIKQVLGGFLAICKVFTKKEKTARNRKKRERRQEGQRGSWRKLGASHALESAARPGAAP